MKEYIDKQAAIIQLSHNKSRGDDEWMLAVESDMGVIRAIPAADVVPVVHGKWMKEDRGHVEYCAVCDQCGFDWMWSDRGYFKFCPNCGAKMDGERKE